MKMRTKAWILTPIVALGLLKTLGTTVFFSTLWMYMGWFATAMIISGFVVLLLSLFVEWRGDDRRGKR